MLKQYLKLKLSQRLSPQQIQLMKLIELPTQDFEQRVGEELNENPALELGTEENVTNDEEFDTGNEEFDTGNDDNDEINIEEYISDDEVPDYRTNLDNYGNEYDEKETQISTSQSFHQELLNQLNTFNLEETEREIAEFLVGNIDDTGYIRRSIREIVDDIAFTLGIYTDEKVVERMLGVIHQFEPAGVGARNLQECLLLQLRHKTKTDAIKLAYDIIENQFEEFSKKHYDKLLLKNEITKKELRRAVAEIERLNPKPGNSFVGSRETENVTPDFIIRIVDNKLELTLNGRNSPSLHVSKEYQEMMQTYKASKDKSKTQKEAVQFIKHKLDSAKWFMDAIKQREETLYVTMNAIMHYQYEYFLEGDETKLKPMILKDIGEMIDLDISTVSRVANSKYVETPYGTKLIKEFFSEAIKNELGEDISTIKIKKILEDILKEEDMNNPYTDEQLTAMLKQKGYTIARRTVAKYREQLEIPVARMRKKI